MITQQIAGVVGVVSTILAYAFYKSWQFRSGNLPLH